MDLSGSSFRVLDHILNSRTRACVYAEDYLSTGCNEALLDCLARLREGTSTFEGNKCMIDEVIDVISLVIEAAVVAGRVLHKP